MTQAARTRLPREMRIAETLVAARAVFEKQGYADTAMSQIASKVGVVEGALYRFFASKADLLMAVTCQWYEEISAPLKAGLPQKKTLRERLHFVVWHHLMCIYTSPELVNLFYNVVRNDKQYLDSDLFRNNRWYVGLVAEILRDGIAAGEVRPDLPVEMVRNMVFGMAEQQTWAYRNGLASLDVDSMANDITDLVLSACRPAAAVTAASARQIAALASQIQALAGAPGGEAA